LTSSAAMRSSDRRSIGTRCRLVQPKSVAYCKCCSPVLITVSGRLSQLSHVLFMDASKFTLEHAFEMALRGTEGEKANPAYHSLRANVGISHEPFIQSEAEPFNRCSLRFCTSHQPNVAPRTQCCLSQCLVHNDDLGCSPFLCLAQMVRLSPHTQHACLTSGR
jgi:hypothetical protein